MNCMNHLKINFIFKQWHKNKNYTRMSKNFFSTEAQTGIEAKKKWNSVIGLEIHAQILSNSKLFSGSSTNYKSVINSNVSFFDCATPGTLPVLNRRCVEAGILTALALSCKINPVSLFDRKHYFYADSPAGYQITQQRQALAVDGELNFQVYNPSVHREPYAKVSKIKQLQLEQDSGKSLHDPSTKRWSQISEFSLLIYDQLKIKNFFLYPDCGVIFSRQEVCQTFVNCSSCFMIENNRSLVDLNRAGVPLMEIVFEPDLTDGEEAAALVKEIIVILQRLKTCSCKMEEGALRVDANISVNRSGEELGTRTEVKNIGSIRAVAGAIKYEIDRQIAKLENGGTIINETRSWDMKTRQTVPMRDKEEKQDYRYMPEPNLPPLHVHINSEEENKYDLVDVPLLRESLPELPSEIRTNLKNKYGLGLATVITIVNENKLLNLFQTIVEENKNLNPKLVANILTNYLLTLVNKGLLDLDTCELNAQHFGELVNMTQNRTINFNIVREVLELYAADTSISPRQIVEQNNLKQITDKEELTKICKTVLQQRPNHVKKYKNGKKKVLKVFLGPVVQETQNRADMAAVVDILKKLLDDE